MATDWLSIGTGVAGLFGANKQNKAINAQNELLKQQYEWEKSKEVPGVEGAQRALAAGAYKKPGGGYYSDAELKELYEKAKAENPELTQDEFLGNYEFESQFTPFANKANLSAATTGDIAQNYLDTAGTYQGYGLQGAKMLADAAKFNETGPEWQKKLAEEYNPNSAKEAYDLAAKDINRNALDQSREVAIRGGRFGALSGQAARRAGQIEQGRNEALLKAANEANTRDEQIAFQRAQDEIRRRQGLSTQLAGFGATGLSQAQSAATLGQGAYQAAVQNPFAPFQQYGQTVSSQPTASVPKYGQTVDPLQAGIGAGIQAWSAFNKNNNNT